MLSLNHTILIIPLFNSYHAVKLRRKHFLLNAFVVSDILNSQIFAWRSGQISTLPRNADEIYESSEKNHERISLSTNLALREQSCRFFVGRLETILASELSPSQVQSKYETYITKLPHALKFYNQNNG